MENHHAIHGKILGKSTSSMAIFNSKLSSRRWHLTAAMPKEHRPGQRQDLPAELHVAQHVVAPTGRTGGEKGGDHGKTMGKPWENHGKTMGKPWVEPWEPWGFHQDPLDNSDLKKKTGDFNRKNL